MYPLRSLTFVAELIHPPAGHTLDQLQRVHHLAFTRDDCRFANFQVVQGGAQLSNPPTVPGAISSAVILPDRLRVQEQFTGLGKEEFEARVGALAELVLEQLSVRSFVAHQFMVQTLVNPRHAENSGQFVGQTMLSLQSDDLECFGRPPGLVGMRLSFPATEQQVALFNVRIENYDRDPRSLFIENTGLFRQVVTAESLPDLASHFEQTYDFIQSRVVSFVARFDAKLAP